MSRSIGQSKRRRYGSPKRKRGPCPSLGCLYCAEGRQHATKKRLEAAKVEP